jgi:hypothetical protein
MARRNQADEYTFDHILLTYNHLRDFIPDFIQPGNGHLEPCIGRHDFIVVHGCMPRPDGTV